MSGILDSKHELLRARLGAETRERAELVLGLLTTARMIDAGCAEMLAAHGLTEGRFAALLAVSEVPGISPAALAERLGVTRATVTGLTEGLVRAGLIARTPGEGDRRSLTLAATAAGEHLLARLDPEYGEWIAGLVGGIGDEQVTVLRASLATLQRALGGGE